MSKLSQSKSKMDLKYQDNRMTYWFNRAKNKAGFKAIIQAIEKCKLNGSDITSEKLAQMAGK